LLKAFREKAKSFASEQKIVMFRERQPELITENIVAWSGKTLMLPLSDAHSFSRSRENSNIELLGENDVSSIIKSSGKDQVALSQELSSYVDAMLHKKIWHEIYVPILFKQYVIGYIYLLRSDVQVSPFSTNVIEFVRQFARILAYSLSINSYFKTETVRESFAESQLVDMSGSGLMFSMPLHGPAIGILNDVELQLHIRDRLIPVKSRVMRRFQDAGRIYLGLKFLDMSPDDTDFLFDFLYGRYDGIMFSDEPIMGPS